MRNRLSNVSFWLAEHSNCVQLQRADVMNWHVPA